jgi:transposase
MAEPSNRKAEVHLASEQRAELNDIVRKGASKARRIQHARILLLCDSDHPDGQRSDAYTAAVVGVSENTVIRVRRRFVRQGQTAALERKPRVTPPVAPKIDGRVEARLITLCCSNPPTGRKQWTLQLLADELGRLGVVHSIGREAVRRCLKKTGWRLGKSNGTASRKRTTRGSSPKWRKSSTFTARNTRKTSR